MPFDVALSWISAGMMTAVLLSMGIRNRRSGWRAQKADTLLDSLLLWAAFRREDIGERAGGPQPENIPPSVALHSTTASDLAMLHAALGISSPVASPAVRTDSPAECAERATAANGVARRG
jgi:hypothetical protein